MTCHNRKRTGEINNNDSILLSIPIIPHSDRHSDSVLTFKFKYNLSKTERKRERNSAHVGNQEAECADGQGGETETFI